jgi:integrase
MPRKEEAASYYRHQETYEGVKIDLSAKNEKDLAEKVRQRKNTIDSGETLDSANLTVRKWADSWIETYKKPRVKVHHYKQCKSYLNNHIIPELGTMRVHDVRPIHLQQLLNKYEGKSTSFLFHLKAVLNGMFSDAVLNRYILVNPATELSAPKGTTGSHRALTDVERAALLTVCKKHKAGNWILLMLYCGLRPQETAPLLWSDIDFDSRCINITKAIESRTGVVAETKTRSGVRSIPIPDEFLRKLKAIKGKPEELIFPTYKEYTKKKEVAKEGGKMLTAKAISRRWDSVYRALDIQLGATLKQNKVEKSVVAQDLSLYCLRHTYCTDLMRAGVAMNTAKYLMGHSDTRMIERIYAHHTEDESIAAIKQLEALYGKLASK